MSNGEKVLWGEAIAKLAEELAKRFPDAYDPEHPEETTGSVKSDWY